MKAYTPLRFLVLCAVLPVAALCAAEGEGSVKDDFSIPDIAEIPAGGAENLRFDLTLDHYAEYGYPESVDGRLVLTPSPYGPIVPMKGDPVGALLYAAFANTQRDAVYLARTGTFTDTLPDGSAFEVPYGWGAVKMNQVDVSLVEGEPIPHFSDNRKEYTLFPLQDLYAGAALGITGLSAMFRYVEREQYVVSLQLGINPLGPLFPNSTIGVYRVPFHLSGGYRFPGVFAELIGDNYLTVGIDLFSGFGDLDARAETPSFFWMPGIFADIEKPFFRGLSADQDFRRSSRPYNYGVNAAFVRAALYLNTVDFIRSGFFVFDLSVGFLLSFSGPSIPEHAFKETKALYVSEEYREEIIRQKERREARNAAQNGSR